MRGLDLEAETAEALALAEKREDERDDASPADRRAGRPAHYRPGRA
ncbi:protein of unknown function (plasmid) [Denitratisoma oestradiolicum]|uniref:Uncharacterized protein n=1 Tax=Denitratisoma oestradiolicum TaxID=311182 RepID=A0A6S6YVI8_9PROT|nr:protein of unknown function [Denitratisoma oestradiolicum]